MKRIAFALAVALLPALAGPPVAPAVILDSPLARPAQPLRLDLVEAQPTQVGQQLRVTFHALNTSSERVEDLQITARRADSVNSAAQAQAELETGTFPYFGPFTSVGALDPGEDLDTEFLVTTQAGAPSSLDIAQPGHYPLMFTLTGTRQGQAVALADERFLLTVAAPDAAAGAAAKNANDGAAGATAEINEDAAADAAARNDAPHGLSVIYPLTAPLDIVPGETGGTPLILESEELAQQLTPGGRLDDLLDIYLTHDLQGAGCVAIDPGLLDTVDRMSRGYKVGSERPAVVVKRKRLRDSWFQDNQAKLTPGSGAKVADQWLTKLRQAQCFLPLPWANTDVNAVAEANNSFLLHEATGRSDVITRVLGTEPAADLVVPDSPHINSPEVTALEAGNYDPALAHLIASAGAESVAEGGDAKKSGGTSAGAESRDAEGGDAEKGDAEENDGGSLESPAARILSAQSALAAELQRTDTVVKLPNNLEPGIARAILDAAVPLMGGARALGIGEIAARAETTGGGKPTVGPAKISQVHQQAHYTDELMRIMVNDPNITMTRYGFTAPLRHDLLIALSMTTPGVDERRLRANSEALQQLRSSVMLIPPGNVYTRSSDSSPLLIVAENGLPLPVQGKIMSDSPGSTLNTPDSIWVPARGSITVSMTANIPGRRDLRLWLATLNGETISQPVIITVQTRGGMLPVYGIIAALVVLGAIIVRRKKKS